MGELVSVILPTYNRTRSLGLAIRGVLAQTYPDLELIVVDDGSTEDTGAVIATFRDPRLALLKQPVNRGVAAARNLGIRAARGTLVAFQDDDDRWGVDKLARQVAHLADQRAGLCLSAYLSLTNDGVRYVGGRDAFATLDFRRGLTGDFTLSAAPCWLVRKDALVQAGLFDEGLRTMEDWELLLRLSRVCTFAHVEQPLHIQDWRRLSGLATHDNRYVEALQFIERKHSAFWKDDSRARSSWPTTVGKALLDLGDLRGARAALLRALRGHSRNTRAWLLLALSLFGRGATRASFRAWRSLRAQLLYS